MGWRAIIRAGHHDATPAAKIARITSGAIDGQGTDSAAIRCPTTSSMMGRAATAAANPAMTPRLPPTSPTTAPLSVMA